VIRALGLLAIALAGCHIGGYSAVGPYARSIQRRGPALAVEMCMIVLSSDKLHDGECQIVMVPLPQPGPPGAPVAMIPR
jgi:hypothetical protein